MPKSPGSVSHLAPTLAGKADRHRCYELSVQCPEAEVDFIDQTYRALRGHSARLLREDFCGTAAVCCEWVKRRKTNRAVGIDIDCEVLDWGKNHNLAALSEREAKRVTLLATDVLVADTLAPDIVAAMNFSYWLLNERSAVRQYFERVLRVLKDDGIFFLDAYGGYDSYRVIPEERAIESAAMGSPNSALMSDDLPAPRRPTSAKRGGR